MLLQHPHCLWLLALAPIVASVEWRAGGPRRRRTTAVRLACVAAAVLALAGPLLDWRRHLTTRLTLIEASQLRTDAGVAELRRQLQPDAILVAYGSRAEVVSDGASLDDPLRKRELLQRLDRPVWPDEASDGINLADALRFAGAQLPEGSIGSIRLLSTGRNDHGDTLAEAWRLSQRGVSVTAQATPVETSALPRVEVRRVEMAGCARVGQTLRADVIVESLIAGSASIRLSVAGSAPIVVRANIAAGENRVVANLGVLRGGLNTIRAGIWSADQSAPDASADPVGACVFVGEPARVLVVEESDTNAANALRAALGSGAVVTSVAPSELDDTRVRSADAIVLADVPVDALDERALQWLRQAVQRGTGLMITGAARSFGPGGYGDSALAPLLPVAMPQQAENVDPSTTLVLIIDSSGSMKGDRLDLAKEVSRLALSHLKPHDKVGIVEFYGGKRWAVPIQSAGNLSVVYRAMDRLSSGGGSTLYPAVEEAAFALHNVNTRSKHVLICSDGFVEDAPFSTLVHQMAEDGITVSTVQVAVPDGSPNQMPDIARWGGGRYYVVPDQYALPDLSLKLPTVSLKSPLILTPTQIAVGEDALLARTAAADFGTVDGYVRTVAKPTADVLLRSTAGDPLLARWRYAAGFVAAMPIQFGSTSSATIQDRPAFQRVMAGLMRQIDSGRGWPARTVAIVRPAGLEVDVTAIDGGEQFGADPLTVTLLDAEGKPMRSALAEAIGSGHWNVLVTGLSAGSYTIRAELNGREVSRGGVAVPAPHARLLVDQALLDGINSFAPLAQQRAAVFTAGSITHVDCRPACVLLTAILMLTHVAIRRWPQRSKEPNPERAARGERLIDASMPDRRLSPASVAGALLAACLITTSARADHDGTTAPATQTTTATTHPIDWNRRIDDALARTGDLSDLSRELANNPGDSPDVLIARARVATERGDLDEALRQVLEAIRLQPDDDALLRRAARLEELVGDEVAARRMLESIAHRSPDAVDVQLRLAMFDLDSNRGDEAAARLLDVASIAPAGARRAAIVAYVGGQYSTAAKCLLAAGLEASPAVSDASGVNVAFRLLKGDAALRAGSMAAAATAFQDASRTADKAADRDYAEERLIASARRAGTLSQLADAWMADRGLPNERLLPLATILDELGRTAELLAWWKQLAIDPARSSVALSDRFVQEVLVAVRTAGRADDAVDVCRELLAKNPKDRSWFMATVQSLLNANRSSEADEILDRAVDATTDSAELRRLATLSSKLGRDTPAMHATRTLTAKGGDDQIDGLLLTASILKRSGDVAQAVSPLHQAAAIAMARPASATIVAAALEDAGQLDEAIALLQQAVKTQPTSDALGRLASLLLRQRRSADAVIVLQQAIEIARDETDRMQFRQQLLDATAAANGLPELIKHTSEQVNGAGATIGELTLLVDADLRLERVDDAVAALKQTGLLTPIERLNRLVIVYLRAGKLDAAADTLRELVAADPKNALVTLERLADTDLKRAKPAEAAQVVSEIERTIGEGPASDELMAGVLNRLGQPADAATRYRRMLAATPANADGWLLWATAMAKAGRVDAARHRLQVLCGDAPDDAVFAAAADGLLNLSASPAVIRVARRDAIARVAERPQHTILYHVLADLSDELGDSTSVVRVNETLLPFSSDERPQCLRELMELATVKHEPDVAVDCGRSLLALGDDFPPQLFLDLGEQLLVLDRKAEASRAFARAIGSGDAEMTRVRLGSLYEKYGLFPEALETLRPGATRHRDDPEYLSTVARLSEAVGQSDDAFDGYLATARVLGREIVADRTSATTNGAQMGTMQTGQRLAFTHAVGGAIAMARSEPQHARLLDQLHGQFSEAMADAVSDPVPSRGVCDLAAALRRAAYAFATPAAADQTDDSVLARWPNADAFKQQAIAARVAEGFVAQAASFATIHGLRADPLVAIAAGADMPSTMPAETVRPSSAPPSVDDAAARLSLLLAHGQRAEASELLAALSSSSAGRTPAALTLVVTAATALGDADAAMRWAGVAMDEASYSGRGSVARGQSEGGAQGAATATATTTATTTMATTAASNPAPSTTVANLQSSYDMLVRLWPHLDSKGHKLLVDRFSEAVIQSGGEGRMRALMAMSALRLLPMLSEPSADADRLVGVALEAVSDKSYDPSGNAARIVLLAPPAGRASVFARALARLPQAQRLAFLMSLTADAPEPFDAEIVSAIRAAADALPEGQNVFWTDWFLNVAQRPVLQSLAEAANRTAIDVAKPSAAYVLTMTAAAYCNGGDPTHADIVARQAIEMLSKSPATPEVASAAPPSGGRAPPERDELLRIAVAALSPAARATLLSAAVPATSGARETVAGNGWTDLLHATLLDALGRREESLAALRSGATAAPTDFVIGRPYLQRLYDDGRFAELADAFSHRAIGGDAIAYQIRAVVGVALQNLYRWRELRSVSIDGETASLPSMDVATAVATNDLPSLTWCLRLLEQQMRQSHGSARLPIMPDAGGLRSSELADGSAVPRAFDPLAGAADVRRDILNSLRVPPAATGVSYFKSGLWAPTFLASATGSQDQLGEVAQAIDPAIEQRTVNAAQRELIAAIAVRPGVAVPRKWLDALWPAALADQNGLEMRRLAAALEAQQAPDAASARSWSQALIADLDQPDARPPSSPFQETIDEQTVARRFATLASHDPIAAEQQLRRMRDRGLVGIRSLHVQVVWARIALERGDVAAFKERVAELLDAWAWQRVHPLPGILSGSASSRDIRLTELLPREGGAEARGQALVDVIAPALASLAEAWPSNTEIPRQLAALGQWAVEHRDRVTANALLQQAVSIAQRQGAGEYQLWVADFASSLDAPDVALTLQRGLLKERCLPACRIEGVLDALQAHQDPSADELRADAMRYCRAPNLLTSSPVDHSR